MLSEGLERLLGHTPANLLVTGNHSSVDRVFVLYCTGQLDIGFTEF